MDQNKNSRTKQELETIADEILDTLKKQNLPIWQVKETLKLAAELSEQAIFK